MIRPRVALIGAGSMAANHPRVIAESPDADLLIIVDPDGVAAGRLADVHQVRATASIDDALRCDMVVVASSTPTHVECAIPLLEAGIPVLSEKPLATTLEGVDQLLAVAERTDTPLMCGLVERFNAAFTTTQQQLTASPTHVVAMRHSPPAGRRTSSVVTDLLLHDLDLVLRLFGADGADLVGCARFRPPDADFDEIVDCSLRFPDGLAALSASRIGQRKVRSLTVHCPDRLVEADLLQQTVTVYRSVSHEMIEGGGGYRSATEVDIVFVRHVGEPLAQQFAHFLAIADGRIDHAEERGTIRPPHALMSEIDTC